jgi:hypothetical protein
VHHHSASTDGGKPHAETGSAHVELCAAAGARDKAVMPGEEPPAESEPAAVSIVRAQSNLGAAEARPSLSRRVTAPKHESSEAFDSLPPLAHDHHGERAHADKSGAGEHSGAGIALRGNLDVEAGGADAGADVRDSGDDDGHADSALRLETRTSIFRPRALIRTASSMLGLIEADDLDDDDDDDDEDSTDSEGSRGTQLTEDINSSIVLCG